MSIFWLADSDLNVKLKDLIEKHHKCRLSTNFGDCKVEIVLSDSKPFIEDKLNWGSVKKNNKFNQVWMNKYFDYCIVLSSELVKILNQNQKEAILDLHLSRIRLQYQPKKIVENGKKIIVKDEYGRTEYTDQIKLDKEGNPKWKLDSLDLQVFASNIKRFGFWCEDLIDFKKAIANK